MLFNMGMFGQGGGGGGGLMPMPSSGPPAGTFDINSILQGLGGFAQNAGDKISKDPMMQMALARMLMPQQGEGMQMSAPGPGSPMGAIPGTAPRPTRFLSNLL